MLANDMTIEEILKEYPELTEENIREAIRYASQILRREEVDDNIPWSVKEWFSEKGFKAVKLVELGIKGADDKTIYALKEGYFGYLFLKLQKGTVIVLRPKDILELLEKTFNIIVVKPNKIRIIKPR